MRYDSQLFQENEVVPTQEVKEDDSPFEGEDELPAPQELLNKVGSSCDAETFISAEDSIDASLGYVDKSNPKEE